MIESFLETLNYNSPKKYKSLEEKVDSLYDGVTELMQYLILGVSRIDESIEKTHASINELYQKVTAAEIKISALEKYFADLNAQKPAEPIQEPQESIRSQAITLLKDLHAPKPEMPAKESKPTHADLMIELKDKLKKYKQQQED